MDSRRQNLKDVSFSPKNFIHAGLWLDKYIARQEDKKNKVISSVDGDKKNYRRNFLDQVSSLPVSETYRKYYKRWEQILADNCKVKPRKAHVKGRMIVGLGSESVLETSVTLHRTYGVPYIPGSALKGLAASYARQKLTDEWNPIGEAYKIVFGDTNDAGYITFFDALYVPETGYQKQPLHPDVITVHHPKYYQGTTPPADWDSPTPIQFLSATGSYLIALAAPELEEEKKWINATFKILEEALKIMGIGAKTSSGYGRIELQAPPVDPDIQKAEASINALRNLPANQIAGRLPSDFYPKWQQLKSHEARFILAKAIMETVHKAGREKASEGRPWYEELKKFLGET